MGVASPQSHPRDELIHYLVVGPDGPIGILEEWLCEESGTTIALVAAQGWAGRHRHEIPVGEIVHIDHAARHVVVSDRTAPRMGARRLERLVDL